MLVEQTQNPLNKSVVCSTNLLNNNKYLFKSVEQVLLLNKSGEQMFVHFWLCRWLLNKSYGNAWNPMQTLCTTLKSHGEPIDSNGGLRKSYRIARIAMQSYSPQGVPKQKPLIPKP